MQRKRIPVSSIQGLHKWVGWCTFTGDCCHTTRNTVT